MKKRTKNEYERKLPWHRAEEFMFIEIKKVERKKN
jgi:hypothetical protein